MKVFTRIVFCIFVISIASPQLLVRSAHAEGGQKAVLVTGASTGIGRNIAEKLAADGHFVYAGARKADDIAALSAIDNIQGVRLDVTVQEEIDATVQLVADGGRGLYAVVNNAGVNVIGPLIEIEEAELDFLFEVNIYGPYRITKSFAPMIIESKGRIVNISSISGTLSGPLYGIYSMSKHALEAYTDSLAWEMEALDVRVIGVEPGNFKSKIGDTRCERLLAQGYSAEGSYFEDHVSRMIDNCKNRPDNTGAEPDAVSAAVAHALFDDRPKEHYLVVPEQEDAEWTIGKAIEEVVSLNRVHAYSYSRDELIQMLDEVMADAEK